MGAAGSGPFFGECGSVTDEEVAEAVGVPGFAGVVRKLRRLRMADVARPGSKRAALRLFLVSRQPDRTRAGGQRDDRASAVDVEIGGHPGFESSLSSRLCELGVQFGDDFVHWSISYGKTDPTMIRVSRPAVSLS
ncbi:DUF3558 domain-containing protein [Rhodococcus hoagii]|nr:DUF3558 domain-containing protein [Prescottella equi]